MKFVTKILLALLLLSLCGISQSAFAKAKWEFNMEDGGVTIYIRPVKDSGINEIKAVGVVSCTTDQAWKLLTTDETFIEIMPNVVESKTIEECGDTCRYVYQYLKLSSIDDRQQILKVRWSVTEKKGVNQYTRKYEKSDKEPEAKEGVTNVAGIKGSWKLRSVEDGKKTKLIYQNHVELGGSVPDFLVNEAAEDNAMNYIKNLKAACDKL